MPHSRDFLLERQIDKLAALAARTHDEGLAARLGEICVVLGATVGPTDGATAPDEVISQLEDIEAVLDIVADGEAAVLAAVLRGVLVEHGCEVFGEVAAVEALAALRDDQTGAPERGAHRGDALLDGVGERLVDLAGAAALAGGIHDPAALDGHGEPEADDVPLRRVLVLVVRRADGRAVSAVEAGASVEALDATLSQLGRIEMLGAPQLRDGAAVVVLGVDGTGRSLALEALPTGHEIFTGVLPVVGADMDVAAVCVADDGADVPRDADGGVDVQAVAATIDIGAVLAGAAGGVADTMAAIHAERDQRLAELIADAADNGEDEAVAELEELAEHGPAVAVDAAGRERLVVSLQRRDGGTLDGDALEQARAQAMATLPRFGRLEQVDVRVEPGRTELELVVADATTAEVSARDVAEGTVVWQGTLPFAGVGLVDARLELAELVEGARWRWAR